MKIVRRLAGIAVAAAAMLVFGGVAQASASTTPAGNVVVQQRGVTTHTVCASKDVILKARGFPASQHVVRATVHIVGSGRLFSVQIPLTNGSGKVDTGNPGPSFAGDMFKVRYFNGRSPNRVAFGASILDC